MNIALIAAMAQELAPLRSKLKVIHRVQVGKIIIEEALLGEQKLLVAESGIGKVNAATAATIVIERYKPDVIINIGSAGSYDPSLNIGDVVIAQEYKYGDVDATNFGYAKGQVPQMPASYHLARSWSELMRTIAVDHSLPYTVTDGLVLTIDSFMSSEQRVKQLLLDFPDVKVSDMEGLAIAQAADKYGISVIGIKAVSDHAGEEESSTTSFVNNLDRAAETSSHFAELLLQRLIEIEA